MEITLALDWTPNTIHTGFYVAQAQGLYQRLGLKINFLSPDIDNYAITSPGRVARGQAHFGICPSEMLMEYYLTPDTPRLVAVAAILQHNISAVVAAKRSGRERPAQLDGCVYAAYDIPLECDIISHMIRQDGGRGDFSTISPPTLGVPEALENGQADAAWMYMGWEGLQAERHGVGLNVFKLEDYGVPYGYAPVLIAHPDLLHRHRDDICNFMAASARGFEFAVQNPYEAARMLTETAQHPTLGDAEFVYTSQHMLSREYLARDGHWGVMTSSRWRAFRDWICEQHLFKDSMGQDIARARLNIREMFTNQFL
jgi:NitT/TauT family transport system substrate-binding protein